MATRDFNYKGHRNSYTELNQPYFWTITVNDWRHLLEIERHKMIIIDSLQWLCRQHLIKVYGFIPWSVSHRPPLNQHPFHSFFCFVNEYFNNQRRLLFDNLGLWLQEISTTRVIAILTRS